MNKYGKVYIGYEPGSEEWEVKDGNYEVVEAEAKNYPEDTNGWESIDAEELLDTIVNAGRKLVSEVMGTDHYRNWLDYTFWQKLDDYHRPSKYYDGENMLVVYYDEAKKKFVTDNDYWNATENEFDYFGDRVVYWATFPEPPVQI